MRARRGEPLTDARFFTTIRGLVEDLFCDLVRQIRLAGHYAAVVQIVLILIFNAIMFLLLEAPLLGYLVRPEATTQRVRAVSLWLNTNGLRVTGWLVGVFGLGLLAQGLVALSG